MKTKSDQILEALKSVTGSESPVTSINEGNLRGVAQQAFDVALKVWEKSLRTELDKDMARRGFKRKDFVTDFKDASFTVVYVDKKGFRVELDGSPFGGSSVSHYLAVTVKNPSNQEIGSFQEVEDFSYIGSIVDRKMGSNAGE